MRALVRSIIPPSQRSNQSTFGQNRAMVQTQRLEKLSLERRKVAMAQVGADPGLTSIFKQKGELLERKIGRLQGKSISDQGS